VLRIEQIEDKDALKQAAILLDRENEKLHKKVVELTEEIARLKGQDPTAAQLQLLYLKELLASRARALFGDKSERRTGEETIEKASDADVTTKPKTGHGPRPQPKLPMIEREHALVRPADRAAEHHRRICRQGAAQHVERGAELPGPRLRDRVVERDHKSRARRGGKPLLDQLPWLEVVRQRDRAEIPSQRRAHARRDREHGADAGDDCDLEVAPALRPGLDLRADGSRHGENAGIAARDKGHMRALRGMAQRRRRALSLLAVAGSMARLSSPRRDAVEIGAVAVERLGAGECGVRFRSAPARIARTKPHHAEMSAHARSSQPGTSTTAR